MQRKRSKIIKNKSGKGGKSFPIVKAKKVGQDTQTLPIDMRGGPTNADGFKTPVDPKTAKSNNLYNPQIFSLGCEKALTPTLNTRMTNKSAFDTLFEDVMNNPAADIGAPPDDANDLESLDVDDGLGDEGGEDEVTFTLPRELAQHLFDALSSQLGGDDDQTSEEEHGADDLGADIDGLGEKGGGKGAFGENVTVEPTPKPFNKRGTELQGKNNKVSGSNLKPGAKASGTAKLDVQPEPKPFGKTGKELQGKNNKVNAPKLPKPGANMFD